MRRLMLVAIAVVAVVGSAWGRTPGKSPLDQLHRVSAALRYFSSTDNSSITLWLRGNLTTGSNRTATIQLEGGEPDLTEVIRVSKSHSFDADLTNVVLMQDDRRSVRILDIREFIKADKPSGIIARKGDIVVLLAQPQEDAAPPAKAVVPPSKP